MSDNHPINGLMATAMNSIKEMVDVNTIVGDAITAPDGTVIIPVSKVSFGFASGGSDFSAKSLEAKPNFGGGSGAGISITPIAFLVVNGGNVKLLQIAENSNTLDRLVALIPDLFDKTKELLNKSKDAGENSGS